MGCANRVENGGFFAKEPATRSSAVGRLSWAASRATVWAASVAAYGWAAGWAEPSLAGRAVNSFFNSPVNYQCLFNIISS